MLLPNASVTDALVTLATHIIRDLGFAGVGVLNLTSAVIGVPGTEPTMLFAGFNVYQHHLTLIGIILFGLLGDLVGASIAYTIGYYGRDPLEEHGAKIHMGKDRLANAQRWFARYGSPVIVVSRCIPFVRAVFPYAAGVARMPYLRFISMATLGSIPWIVGLGVLGREVGRSWESWRHNLEYVDYACVALLICAIGYLIVKRRGGGGGGPAPDAVA